jgi:hypothetical protein
MRRREGWPAADEPDDVDRLFARLESPAPPPDLALRILARTSRRARVRWGLWVGLAVSVGLVAAVLAAVSGYLTGQELVRSGALDLLRLALEDGELVSTAPGDYLLVLVETLPWGGLLATLACVVAAYAVTRPLARAPQLLAASARGA